MAAFRAFPVYALLASVVIVPPRAVRAQTPSAQAVVPAPREALGGEQRLSAITSALFGHHRAAPAGR